MPHVHRPRCRGLLPGNATSELGFHFNGEHFTRPKHLYFYSYLLINDRQSGEGVP